MKRLRFLLLVGGLIAGIFSITAYTTAAGGPLTSHQLGISERAKHEERIDPQLEPFDKACEESIKEFYVRLAQEKEPQLEPFDKACEESIKQLYVRLAQEKEPQLEPFDKACEESIKELYLRLAQEREPQLEPFDKACEESIKELYLRLAQESQWMDTELTLAK